MLSVTLEYNTDILLLTEGGRPGPRRRGRLRHRSIKLCGTRESNYIAVFKSKVLHTH